MCCITAIFTLVFSPLLSGVYILTVVFITFISPFWLIFIQKYKKYDNICLVFSSIILDHCTFANDGLFAIELVVFVFVITVKLTGPGTKLCLLDAQPIWFPNSHI